MGITVVERSGEDQEKIVFKIDNFAKFLEMSNEELEEHGVTFEAGHCSLKDGTQVPATWKYSFEHTDTTTDYGPYFGGFLVLHRPTNKSQIKSANASWSVSLTAGGYGITSVDAQRKEFAGTSGFGRSSQVLMEESELLEYTAGMGVVDVTLLVKVFSDNNVKHFVRKNPSPNSAEHLRGQMTSDLAKMLESGDGADVDIKIPSETGEVEESSYTKKAHKGILMSRSSVFAKMFAKDSTMTEAKTGVVVIKDLSKKGLDVFLHYLYTGEVLQDWGEVGPEILNAAEKYDCEQLKQYCGLNIMDAVSTSNAMDFYTSAKLHGLLDAAKEVASFISKNTVAVLDHVVENSK